MRCFVSWHRRFRIHCCVAAPFLLMCWRTVGRYSVDFVRSRGNQKGEEEEVSEPSGWWDWWVLTSEFLPHQFHLLVSPRDRIFKLLRSPGISSKEPIPPGCAAWRGPVRQPYSYSVPSPIDCLKIPAQDTLPAQDRTKSCTFCTWTAAQNWWKLHIYGIPLA
jgi:hypothetical protein